MAEKVGTLVCFACGGSVAKNAPACPYCGAIVVLPTPFGADAPAQRRTFCPRCGNMYPSAAARCPRCPPSSTDERGGRCPRCAADLQPVGMGTVTVDRCSSCKGTWFDGDELEHAMDLTTQGLSREDAGSLRRVLPTSNPTEEVKYVACVRCGERMARRQLAPRMGIIVDICRSHGIWFDGGELERFAAFARAGGLEVLRHDGVAAAEERERARASLAPVPDPVLGLPRPTSEPLSLPYELLRALRRWLYRRV